MRTEKVLILSRMDLRPDTKSKPIDDIKFDDFMMNRNSHIRKHKIILFIDNKADSPNTTVLKNFYGDKGLLTSR